jgi:hypothetical protein
MQALITFLLKAGGDLLVRHATRQIAGMLAAYGLIAGFALAALVFLYIAIYGWLTAALDAQSAAAILCGVNLLGIALVLFARWLSMRRRRVDTARRSGLFEAIAGSGSSSMGGDLEAALAIGLEAGERIRKAAPQIALVAGLIGIIVGTRPEILDILRPRPKDPRGR